jgi:hypothetical protein
MKACTQAAIGQNARSADGADRLQMKRIEQKSGIWKKGIELLARCSRLGFQSFHGALEDLVKRFDNRRRLNPEMPQSVSEERSLLDYISLKRLEPRRLIGLCPEHFSGHR